METWQAGMVFEGVHFLVSRQIAHIFVQGNNSCPNQFLSPVARGKIRMKNSGKGKKKEIAEEDKVLVSHADEMGEIEMFIRKKRLQNQVLKKLAESMLPAESGKINKPASK